MIGDGKNDILCSDAKFARYYIGVGLDSWSKSTPSNKTDAQQLLLTPDSKRQDVPFIVFSSVKGALFKAQ